LVENGSDVHARDDETLIIAIKNNNLEMVKYLVGVGANVFARGIITLSKCIVNGNVSVAKYLIGVGVDVNVIGDMEWKIISILCKNAELIEYVNELRGQKIDI